MHVVRSMGLNVSFVNSVANGTGIDGPATNQIYYILRNSKDTEFIHGIPLNWSGKWKITHKKKKENNKMR